MLFVLEFDFILHAFFGLFLMLEYLTKSKSNTFKAKLLKAVKKKDDKSKESCGEAFYLSKRQSWTHSGSNSSVGQVDREEISSGNGLWHVEPWVYMAVGGLHLKELLQLWTLLSMTREPASFVLLAKKGWKFYYCTECKRSMALSSQFQGFILFHE